MNPNDGAPAGAAIAGAIGGLGCGILLGTVIGAVILRLAVSLYNAMAGGERSSSGVAMPDFGKAMLVMFSSSLINGVLQFGVSFALGVGLRQANAPPEAQMLAGLVSLGLLPVTLLVLSGLISAIFPTTFGKAILVALCLILVSLMIGLGFAVIAVAVMLGLRGLRP